MKFLPNLGTFIRMSDKEIARLMKLFGAHLKKIRESKNLSLLDTDYGSTLNESNISKYENGRREPQLSTIFKLAKALKVHPKDLFDFGVDYSKD